MTAVVLVCALAVAASLGPAPAVAAETADRPVTPAAVVPPPVPPPVRAGPPAGQRPGAAPGLEAPARCTPPASDGAPAGAPPAALRVADAHRVATGRGQLIAVVDTGVAPHPLLAGRLSGGGDYLTGGDGLDDCDGHGTAVAGLIAAAPEPGARTATPVGIAPGARLLAIRQSSPSYAVPGPDGALRPAGDTDTLAEAVVLAVRGGAGVVNISEAVCLPAERAAAAGAPLQAALRYAADADVVVVAAAGNVGSGSCTDGTGSTAGQVSLPGWYDDHVLTVGAVEPGDGPASFTVPGPWVDLAAPGTGLRSLTVGGGATAEGVAGTSFAAPWVAGLAALVRERYPTLTARQVVDRIVLTARPTPDARGAVGSGVVDPMAALTALSPGPTETSEATETPVADLPGTTRPPAPPPAPTEPAALTDVLAVGVLLAVAALAAALLGQRPRRRR